MPTCCRRATAVGDGALDGEEGVPRVAVLHPRRHLSFALPFAAAGADVRIDLHRDGRPVFVSRLRLGARGRSPIGALARVLLRWPLMTAHVIGAIHWEALRLWRKGLPTTRSRAYDPARPVVTRP